MTPDDESAPTTAGNGPSDETVIVPPATQAAPELAWSAADPDEPAARQSWRSAWTIAGIGMLCATVTAVSIAVFGTSSRPTPNAGPIEPSTRPAESLPPPPPSAAETLNGAYELVFDLPNATYRGNMAPPTNQLKQTSWWAFRPACTGAGACTASGVQLDASDHLAASSFPDGRPGPSVTDSWRYQDGAWKEIPFSLPNDVGGPNCPTATTRRILHPLPDGTLTGTETDVIIGTCRFAGNTTVIPIAVTRIGPVPPGVLTAEIN